MDAPHARLLGDFAFGGLSAQGQYTLGPTAAPQLIRVFHCAPVAHQETITTGTTAS
jgi:hypothetical protein